MLACFGFRKGWEYLILDANKKGKLLGNVDKFYSNHDEDNGHA